MLALALSAGCPHGPSPTTRSDPPPEPALDPGPIDLRDVDNVGRHLRLPPGEEGDRAARAADVVAAWRTVGLFAAAHGWTALVTDPPCDRVEVYATAEELWARLLVVSEAPADTPRPAALPDAALEHRVLLAVSAGEYARRSPEFATAGDAWSRLLAHEMVHRVHVAALAAAGRTEDAMGPRWFYEGLAVVGSGQDLDVAGGLAYKSADEALAGVASGDPRLAYPRYAAAVRWFAKRAPVPELVARAGDPEFEAWLRALR